MDEKVWYLTQKTRDRVANAAAPFVGRWKLQTLELIDPVMHEAIVDQQRMLHEAYLEGSADEIRQHGSAMCRGWRGAALSMREANQPDDAYLLVEDRHTGYQVAIIAQKNPDPELIAAVQSAAPDALVMAPHEVAAACTMPSGHSAILREVRELWPSVKAISVREKTVD